MALYFSSVKLVDGAEELVLWPGSTNGVCSLVALNFGAPNVREVTEDKPNTSGALDYTTLFGAAAVSATVTIRSNISATRRMLARWTRPDRRPILKWTVTGGTERQMTLRGSTWEASLDRSALLGNLYDIQLQWVAPDPRAYSSTEMNAVATLALADPGAGRSYPLTYERMYPATTSAGLVTVDNTGDVSTSPRIIIMGDAVNPKLTNETTGRILKFTYSLGVGHSIHVDFALRTAWLDGVQSPAYNLRNKISTVDWWELVEGDNDIRYSADTGSATSSATVYWRNAEYAAG